MGGARTGRGSGIGGPWWVAILHGIKQESGAAATSTQPDYRDGSRVRPEGTQTRRPARGEGGTSRLARMGAAAIDQSCAGSQAGASTESAQGTHRGQTQRPSTEAKHRGRAQGPRRGRPQRHHPHRAPRITWRPLAPSGRSCTAQLRTLWNVMEKPRAPAARL